MIITKLLKYFLIEELRLHTNLYKSHSFFTYPIVLFLFFLGLTISSILLYDTYYPVVIGNTLIYLFFAAGLMSGAFGLYAKDYLERKFGDFNRLFSNTQIMPIPLKKTFLVFAISDSIFYTFWFIIPSLLGFLIGVSTQGFSILFGIRLIISSLMLFLLGLFSMFFISILYERSKQLFMLYGFILGLVLSIFLIYSQQFFIEAYYLRGDVFGLITTLLLLIILIIISYYSVGDSLVTNTSSTRSVSSYQFPQSFNPHIFKDYIDLKRTGGLLGKPLFTVLIPSVLLLYVFSTIEFLAQLGVNVLFFSIILATLSTQLLNSLIVSDDFRYYRFLPVQLGEYIRSKMKLSFIICFLIGSLVLLCYCLHTNQFDLLAQGLIILFSLLIYNFNLSFYLTGLEPNERLMQTSVFLLYFLFFFPVLLSTILIFLLLNSILFYTLYIVVLLIFSFIFLKLGIRKWGVER
ncbi:MAG: hypothetical protein ACLFPL_03280 [Candidatus Nanoarchaeia archaeon]